MNRVVFLMNADSIGAIKAAQWFAAHGDTVFVGNLKPADAQQSAIHPIAFDPLSDESLTEAVKTVGSAAGRLDILVLGAMQHPRDGGIGTIENYDALTDTVTENVLSCRKTIEAFVPLLENGMKRIACITEKESSNTWGEGSENLSYYASLAAINMLGRMMFNKLRPEGFTFRWYCEENTTGGMCAASYITSALCYDPKEPYTHSDENRFILRDAYLRELSW